MKSKCPVFTVLFCLFFSSCFSGLFDDRPEKIEGEKDPYTVVGPVIQGKVDLRNNVNQTNGHAVEVYTSQYRSKLIATVPALSNLTVPFDGQREQEFHFTYLLKIPVFDAVLGSKDIKIDFKFDRRVKYGRGAILVSFPFDQTRTVSVNIPSIHDTIIDAGYPSEVTLPLVDDIYFSITNNSSTSIWFRHGNNTQIDIEQGSNIHNTGETRVYCIPYNQTSSVNTSGTNIMSTGFQIPYALNTATPATTFKQGYLYEIEFATGGAIKVTKETPINCENTGATVTRVNVTFDPNGAGGSSMVISNLISGLEISLQDYNSIFTPPPGRTFGGWNTNQNGSGANYTENYIVPEFNTILYARWLAPGDILNIVDTINVGGLYQGDISFGNTQYISVYLTPGTYRFTCVDSDTPGVDYNDYADILTGLAKEDGSIIVPIVDRWVATATNPVNTFDYTVTAAAAGTYLIAVRANSSGYYDVWVDWK